MSAGVPPESLERAFLDDRRSLWALCYRMTGSAADAEDLVQATFERALSRPPPDTRRPWRPWLFRVAVNLARDHLRRRRRQPYKGPWLPEPVDTDALVAELAEPRVEPADTEGRYDLLESVSFAFLVALEALTPTQRAVLLLRDVVEQPVREVAEALEMSEANVRTTHLRARRAMAAYDAARARPTEALEERARELLTGLVTCMVTRDHAALEALLCEDALALNDGAGRYAAAGVPIHGRERVARFHIGITKGSDATPELAWCRLNGLPAVVIEYDPRLLRPRRAARNVVLPGLGADGRLAAVYMLVAPGKLGAVPGVGEARDRYAQ